VVSILVAAVVGIIAFGPFKSWASLVSVVTGATAVMYAFAPVALNALHKIDGDRPRSYRVPLPKVVLPAAFCSANLIIYWGGYDYTWKIALALLVGLVLFLVGAAVVKTHILADIKHAWWMVPWIAGTVVIGILGRYGADGDGHQSLLPDWVDVIVVIAFSLVIFYLSTMCALPRDKVLAAVEKDAHQLSNLDDLQTA
jgi:amino acid transporter